MAEPAWAGICRLVLTGAILPCPGRKVKREECLAYLCGGRIRQSVRQLERSCPQAVVFPRCFLPVFREKNAQIKGKQDLLFIALPCRLVHGSIRAVPSTAERTECLAEMIRRKRKRPKRESLRIPSGKDDCHAHTSGCTQAANSFRRRRVRRCSRGKFQRRILHAGRLKG